MKWDYKVVTIDQLFHGSDDHDIAISKDAAAARLQRHFAELVSTVHGVAHGVGHRPVERQLDDFATADFAHRFDDEPVVARLQRTHGRMIGSECPLVRLRRRGRAGHRIGRPVLVAADSPPPLTQVGQPLASVLAGLQGIATLA